MRFWYRARRRLVPIGLGVACGLILWSVELSLTVKVIILVGFATAVALLAIRRELSVQRVARRRAAAGDPEAILLLAERGLARRPSDEARVPLLIYMAGALAMKGQHERALKVLEGVKLGSVPEPERRNWAFIHHCNRASNLAFLGKLEEARAALEGDVEPLADRLEGPGPALAVEELSAVLAFFEGAHDDSRARLEPLAADDKVPPSSRGMHHYLLGRICAERGERVAAVEHFERATRLAPGTFAASESARLRRHSAI